MTVPRMFREPSSGEAVPTEAETLVGEKVDFDKIELSGSVGEEKIFRYVQEPLRKWLANFDTVVVSCMDYFCRICRFIMPDMCLHVLCAASTSLYQFFSRCARAADLTATGRATATDSGLSASLCVFHGRCVAQIPCFTRLSGAVCTGSL